jgi:hypothetical protein
MRNAFRRGARLDGSLIASIQRGTITITSSGSGGGNVTATATITSVDVNRAVLHFLGVSSNAVATGIPGADVQIVLTDATTITATVGGQGDSAVSIVSYEVVEYLPGVIKQIQRGSILITSATSATAALSPEVVVEKTQVVGGNFFSTGTTTTPRSRLVRLALTSSALVTATDNTAGDANAAWQAVEWW